MSQLVGRKNRYAVSGLVYSGRSLMASAIGWEYGGVEAGDEEASAIGWDYGKTEVLAGLRSLGLPSSREVHWLKAAAGW